MQRLAGASVVLTTYDVLQREVHFSPNLERISSLRSEKRYQVPESPLLTLRHSSTPLLGGSLAIISILVQQYRVPTLLCKKGIVLHAATCSIQHSSPLL